MVTLFHSVSETLLVLGFRAQDFIFNEFTRPGLVLLWVSENLKKNSVRDPWYSIVVYADQVPLCFGDYPGPRIQCSGYHLLWVHGLRSSPFMSFREAYATQCWTPPDMLTLWHSVSETLLVLGYRAWNFIFYEFRSPGLAFYEFKKLMQNSVGYPRYADLVPICIRDSPGPEIQTWNFIFYEFRSPILVLLCVHLCKTVLDTLDMPTLCYSVSGTLLVLGFRAWDFIFYEFTSPDKILLWVSWVSEKLM